MAGKAQQKRAATSQPPQHAVSELARLRAVLMAHTAAEDLAAYDPPALDRAAELALFALKAHRRGRSVVRVENDPELVRQGRPVTALTVVNDNMPFLFDSVLGEITESVGEPLLVLHPVVRVRYGGEGVREILPDSAAKAVQDLDKVSLIHMHVARLSQEDCEALRGRLEAILNQVRAAVTSSAVRTSAASS
jgi:glutamate dehydrogenase